MSRGGGTEFKGLRDLVREIVERDVLRASARQASSGWLVLVLDATASKVLTPILGMYDLMEERVTLVESLEKRRQPFPEFDVIYVAAAEDKSIRAIKADWVGRSEAMYGDAHCFFLSQLSEDQVADLGMAGSLARRLKTLSELNLDFLAIESQAFALAEAGAFQASGAAAAAGGALEPAERNAARKFATVCATLDETAPVFRYKSERARSFAELASRQLASMARAKARANVSSSQAGRGSRRGGPVPKSRGPATVLLLDRADDLLTPLLHEYSYQAMVHDMLRVEGDARDRVTYAKATRAGETKDDVALLNEKDALWVEFRHAHVAKVVDALRARVSDFLAHNAGAAQLSRGAGRDLSLGGMASALKKMPEFQAATAALNKHMTLSHECLSKFHSLSLLEQSQLEQTLATGADDDGVKLSKPQTLLSDVCAAVEALKHRADPADADHAVRLVAVYFVARKGRLAESERSRLFDALAPTGHDRAALLTVAKSAAAKDGIPSLYDAARVAPVLQAASLQRQTAKQRKPKKSGFATLKNALRSAARGAPGRSASSDADAGDDVAGSRYVPPAKLLIEAAAYDRLPDDIYPRLGGRADAGLGSRQHSDLPAPPAKVAAQSVRNRANRFPTASGPPGAPPGAGPASAAALAKTFVGPRLIVLVLGGVTYSELRSAYEVSDATNREVLIGGTDLLAPSTFVAKLAGNN